MKKLIYVSVILLLCVFAVFLISCRKSYDITYELNGGTRGERSPSRYREGIAVTLGFPEKEGYMFAGWYTEPEFENALTEITADATGDIDLYARWERVDDILTLKLNDQASAYFVTDCIDDARVVVIPSTYNGLPIVAIDSYAFAYCRGLQAIVVPDSINTIKEGAFTRCKSLKGLYIPDTVTRIEHGVFRDCDSIEEFTVGSHIEYIGMGAFSDCDSLRIINLPNKNIELKSYIFTSCDSLERVIIPDEITCVDDYTFYGCKALKEVVIGKGVSYLNSNAFTECSSFERVTVHEENEYYVSIDGVLFSKSSNSLLLYPNGKRDEIYVIPDETKEICDYAFKGSLYLKNVTIPKTVKLLGEGAFQDCTALELVRMETGVSHIGDKAFSGCTVLKSVELPRRLTRIGSSAFAGCTSLKSIKIPDSVSRIGSVAFSNIPITIYCEAKSKPSGWEHNWSRYVSDVVWGYKEN